MTAITFDTHEFIRKLEEAGFDPYVKLYIRVVMQSSRLCKGSLSTFV